MQRLTTEDKIKRIVKGIYFLPKKHERLDILYPHAEEINKALMSVIGDDVQKKFLAIQSKVTPEAKKSVSLHDVNVYARVKPAFEKLSEYFSTGKLEFSPDLHSKVNETLDYTRKWDLDACEQLEPKTAAKALKHISEALSELEYAVFIVRNERLRGKFVVGAQGSVWSPQQIEAPKPEVKHGSLPPLDVIRLEVDGYSQTSDGVLHADEVKD